MGFEPPEVGSSSPVKIQPEFLELKPQVGIGSFYGWIMATWNWVFGAALRAFSKESLVQWVQANDWDLWYPQVIKLGNGKWTTYQWFSH